MFKIEAAALRDCVRAVNSVIERRNTVPILAYVVLGVDKKGISILGTDLDMWIERRVACDGGKPFRTTVNASVLAGILGKFPKADIVTGDLVDGKFVLTGGRSKFTLATLPADDFPVMTEFEPEQRFDIAASALLTLFDDVSFAQSTEEVRYYLNGALLHLREGDLALAATDGHRLAVSAVSKPENISELTPVIVLRKTISVLSGLLGAAGDDVVSVEIRAKGRLRFEIGDVTLNSKAVDGTFPEYERVIPTNNDKQLAISPKDFLAAVDRVATMSTEKTRAVKMSITGAKVTLSVTSPEHGMASEDIAADYAGEDLDIGFNAKYLADVLKRSTDDAAQLSLSDSAGPVLVRDSARAARLFVLMPMRV